MAYERKHTSKREQLRMDRAALIRELLAAGHSQAEVGRKLGISKQTVNQILYAYKRSARMKLLYAVKKGYIIKPSECDFCHIPSQNLHGHHEDYGIPLEVKWLCKRCHWRIGILGWEEMNKIYPRDK